MAKEDKKTKTIDIEWGGLKVGPVFLPKGFKDGQKIPEDLEKLQKEFMKQDLAKVKPAEMGKFVREFAEKKGYEVAENFYERDLQEAMSEDEEKEFKEALRKGEVEFVYMKKDGTERKAKGTLNPEIIDAAFDDKKLDQAKKKRFVPPTVMVYWDCDAKAFRSFIKDNFVSWTKPEDGDK